MRGGQPPGDSEASPPEPVSRPSPLWPEPWPQGLRAQHRASAPGPNDRELSTVQATASWPGRRVLWLPWRLPSLLAPAPRPQLSYQSPRALFPLLGKGGEGRWTQALRGLQRLGDPGVALLQAWWLQEPRSSPSSVPTSLGCPGSPALLSSTCQVGPAQQKGVVTSLPGASISADAALARSLSALTP